MIAVAGRSFHHYRFTNLMLLFVLVVLSTSDKPVVFKFCALEMTIKNVDCFKKGDAIVLLNRLENQRSPAKRIFDALNDHIKRR